MFDHRYLGPPCFAHPNAVRPRVTEVCVPNTSAVPKPRTTVSATASFAGFLNSAALRADKTHRLCRDC